ncbi:aldo/keto reductase [Achromatium sp. WMS3]|nr:aldo/keto reductase [Achromatium sp. WMS3]
MEPRNLGDTGITVSPLGLGTVKFGRTQQVKYPHPFKLPDDQAVQGLLELALELGINLIDTAPAYGTSMERLGKLLPGQREDWVIVSKVGEIFEQGQSRFEFDYETTIRTVENSLRTLKMDYLDAVLIHSNGDDLRILEQEAIVEALQTLKNRGLIRASGLSGKTVAGGLKALDLLDIVMLTLHPNYLDELPVLDKAKQLNKGVLIKKGLQSGHIANSEAVQKAMQFIFSYPGISSLIVGTINPKHLKANVAIVKKIIDGSNVSDGYIANL